MESILKYMLYVISVVALGTGLNVLVGGASAIPGANGGVEATVDNELRFFAVFWVAYGAFCFWLSRNIREQYVFVPFIALVFFLGGVGRLLSTLLVGAPADILVSVMVLEFVVPVVIYVIYLRLLKTNVSAIN